MPFIPLCQEAAFHTLHIYSLLIGGGGAGQSALDVCPVDLSDVERDLPGASHTWEHISGQDGSGHYRCEAGMLKTSNKGSSLHLSHARGTQLSCGSGVFPRAHLVHGRVGLHTGWMDWSTCMPSHAAATWNGSTGSCLFPALFQALLETPLLLSQDWLKGRDFGTREM